jgi:hypothetical protein
MSAFGAKRCDPLIAIQQGEPERRNFLDEQEIVALEARQAVTCESWQI